jgi:acetyl esterase/lipase|tara:strand:+ start:4454 stop:5491 length:1038 start_codon:yes stop_codon:yes gene_type:complete
MIIGSIDDDDTGYSGPLTRPHSANVEGDYGMVVGMSVWADHVNKEGGVEWITPSTTIGDILVHPAFKGFSARLLPRMEDQQQSELTLQQMDSLMPFHAFLNPHDIAIGLNFLVYQAGQQIPVFLELYSAAEKREDPGKTETGLLFFKGKPGAPFAIIAPGGGFAYVATLHEGVPLARELAEQGMNAFVVRYRTGQGQRTATEDLARAITLLFREKENLEIGTRNYSIWGASAGARTAALIGSYGPGAFGGTVLQKPACVVMLYTGHSDSGNNEPATFVAVGDNDGISPPAAMRQRLKVLEKAGTPVEFHVFPEVGHGFGLGTGSSAEGWIDDAIQFWRDRSANGY